MSEVMNIDESNFKSEILDSQVLAVVDFGAEWCAPCKKIHPLMAELSVEYNNKVKMGYVDVGVSPGVAQQYAVMSVPRLVFFKEGKPVDTIIGAVPKSKIDEKIKANI